MGIPSPLPVLGLVLTPLLTLVLAVLLHLGLILQFLLTQTILFLIFLGVMIKIGVCRLVRL